MTAAAEPRRPRPFAASVAVAGYALLGLGLFVAIGSAALPASTATLFAGTGGAIAGSVAIRLSALIEGGAG